MAGARTHSSRTQQTGAGEPRDSPEWMRCGPGGQGWTERAGDDCDPGALCAGGLGRGRVRAGAHRMPTAGQQGRVSDPGTEAQGLDQ